VCGHLLAGIIGQTRRLAEQVAAHGVTVNAIAPGRFDTALANRSSPEVIAQAVANITAKRVGHPMRSRRSSPSWSPMKPAT